MAINAAAIWELRTTGSTNNGGGFVTGGAGAVDYSQQDAAQYTFSDLASTVGTTNPAVVTSASHNFVAADVGNIIHITAGTNWTAGFYQIVSVAGNAATLDKACGTSATLSAGTFFVGGALALGAASDATWITAAIAGNYVYVKAGTYTTIGANATINAASGNKYVTWEGYNTSRGDIPTGANRPLVNLGATTFVLGANATLKNISLTFNGGVIQAQGNNIIQNCKVVNSQPSAAGDTIIGSASGTGANVLINSEIICYKGNALRTASTAPPFVIIGCYIHDSDKGIVCGGSSISVVVMNSIIANCTTGAIDLTSLNTVGVTIQGCTIYGAENKLGTGIKAAANTTMLRIINSIIYGFVTGVNQLTTTPNQGFDDFNDYFNNTTDNTNWAKGPSSLALNPTFASIAQVTGTTATSTTNVLTDAGANFSNVTDNVDFVTITVITGTGSVTGKYLITGHTTTTLTLSSNLTTSGNGTAITYEVTTGRNFAIGTNLKAGATPKLFGTQTSNYLDIGGAQRQEAGGAAGMLYMPNLEGT